MFSASVGVRRFPIFRLGWTGVDLFFVLSGFLIGSQLWKELDRNNRIRIGRFLLRRGLRIWPLYYAVVIFIAAQYLFGTKLPGIWVDFGYVSNMFSGQVSGGWSLSTEEQFYTLTPIVLSLFALKIRPRRMWILPLFAIVALVSARAWVALHSTLPEAALRTVLYFPIYTHADGLAVGMFLAWIAIFKKHWLQSKLFVAVAAGVMLACGLLLYRVSSLLLNFTALGLIYGCLELYGISVLPLPGVLHWRGFYLVSRLSFGLYLNHSAVLFAIYPKLADLSERGPFGFWGAYLLSLLVSLAVAMFTFLSIERPFLRLRARWLDREKRGAVPEVQFGLMSALHRRLHGVARALHVGESGRRRPH
jgi:peptidoglycan/LPS O-acetylase OafA/YrhL